MQYSQKKPKATKAKLILAGNGQTRADQFTDRRLRDAATRSTLARLRNRKSDLK